MLPHGGRLSLVEKQNHEEKKMIMSKIVNEAKIKNPFIAKIRELLEHRAFWLYLLVGEAEKKGCAATTASASALMPVWSCPRPLPRVTTFAPCATSSPALSRWRNEKSGHFFDRQTVPAAICGGPVYDHRYIKKTVETAFPYAAAAPFILPAGTDARRFTGLSNAVIRFAPIDIDKQQYASVHGENENISLDKLYLAVDFYKALLRNYPQA